MKETRLPELKQRVSELVKASPPAYLIATTFPVSCSPATIRRSSLPISSTAAS
jgi:hypothetical protein